MPTEADTCRTLISPKLQVAGWENDPHSIAEQRTFTDGRIIVRGSKAERRKGKRADYILRHTRDFPIAATEGDIGRGHLSRFQDVDTQVPAILTTSQLLNTGVDAPTCKHIVLARVVGSMTEIRANEELNIAITT